MEERNIEKEFIAEGDTEEQTVFQNFVPQQEAISLKCICEHEDTTCTVSCMIDPNVPDETKLRIICEQCFNIDFGAISRIKLQRIGISPDLECGLCGNTPSRYNADLQFGVCDTCRDLHVRVYLEYQTNSEIPTEVEIANTILDNQLYLGSLRSTASKEILQQMGITAILNCADSIPEYHAQDIDCFIRYHRLPMSDSLEEDIMLYLPSAMIFLEECIRNGGKVLVHCHAGE
jgi:hypothetical protein